MDNFAKIKQQKRKFLHRKEIMACVAARRRARVQPRQMSEVNTVQNCIRYAEIKRFAKRISLSSLSSPCSHRGVFKGGGDIGGALGTKRRLEKRKKEGKIGNNFNVFQNLWHLYILGTTISQYTRLSNTVWPLGTERKRSLNDRFYCQN